MLYKEVRFVTFDGYLSLLESVYNVWLEPDKLHFYYGENPNVKVTHTFYTAKSINRIAAIAIDGRSHKNPFFNPQTANNIPDDGILPEVRAWLQSIFYNMPTQHFPRMESWNTSVITNPNPAADPEISQEELNSNVIQGSESSC